MLLPINLLITLYYCICLNAKRTVLVVSIIEVIAIIVIIVSDMIITRSVDLVWRHAMPGGGWRRWQHDQMFLLGLFTNTALRRSLRELDLIENNLIADLYLIESNHTNHGSKD